jgi:hypothetical protein
MHRIFITKMSVVPNYILVHTNKHKQIVLQWIQGHSQIAGNEYANTLAKKDVKITQTHIREISYHSIKLHLKQVFQSAYRQELRTKVSQKPWKQELAKIPDWPRRKAGSCNPHRTCSSERTSANYGPV